ERGKENSKGTKKLPNSKSISSKFKKKGIEHNKKIEKNKEKKEINTQKKKNRKYKKTIFPKNNFKIVYKILFPNFTIKIFFIKPNTILKKNFFKFNSGVSATKLLKIKIF
ncbi:hypothetical protein ISU75_19220, partial [Leptospira borgpetersenii serovar Hardjo-bovis]|nr:hypothetical protein [Leptospira borgpetersenii serovar Hardjo-bovis]